MEKSLAGEYLDTVSRRLRYYKDLGEKTFDQLQDKDFHFAPDPNSNSIAVIIQHIHGNMMSRWTNFLSEDGEKTWRQRDAEFESRNYSKVELLDLWKEGWDCFFDALSRMDEKNLLQTIYIRQEPLTVMDAVNRQLAHYPYHIGQILYLGRMIRQQDWKNLSIPKGKSDEYNAGQGIKDPARIRK